MSATGPGNIDFLLLAELAASHSVDAREGLVKARDSE